MSLNIKSDEAHALTRELAALTGESMTEAVTVSVRERLERLRTESSVEERTKRILELGRAIAAHMGPDTMRVEDLYDDSGLPA